MGIFGWLKRGESYQKRLEREARVGHLEANQRRARRRTEALIASSVPSLDQRVRELVAAGKKLPAISLYRTETGADLRTAKEAVDRIAASISPGSN